ncbi:hypothetical protein QL992_02870 [Microbacterium sp. APC 3898]|uniref:Formylmethanofuran dehydrogenase subunit E domain-containing protein n=1 Tax=Planococcus notacanthi TaxID=3035188 RepID=A0ABT7ZH14_9BACL|nr:MULTISPECIES: FmdE family protein [Terrabacteria group]MDN3426445.1 hypothetical protein [Planococcus sp. APC 4016]MDN3498140.1 hypothetical protein [Microbacterium sp. APC 3898]
MTGIKIYDHGELLEIGFQDIRKFHGIRAYMAIGVAYRIMEAAFEALYGNEVPSREDISIVSGHGGPGFRDAFEFVTRADTRGEYLVDVSYPQAQYDPHRPTSYAYVFKRQTGEQVEVSLKEDFLPAVFYEYLKKGREDSFTAEEFEACEKLKKELCMRALKMPLESLLEVRHV